MKLADDERELLMAETRQAVEQIRSPELRTAYEELLAAVEHGEIPKDLMGRLQVLLEVGLESGRIRKLHSAHGEMAGQRVFRRTPAGLALQASIETVNQALDSLEGGTILGLRIGVQGPGCYLVTVGTDRGSITVRIDRQGVRIPAVEVGG